MMVRILIFTTSFLSIFFSLPAQEKSSYRWKETTRLDNEQYTVSYLDTLILHTEDRIKMTIFRNGIGYRGEVIRNQIDFVVVGYNVFKSTEDTIIFSTSRGYHIFTRDLLNQHYADAPQKIKELGLPEASQSEIDLNEIAGNWSTYKRVNRSGPMKRVKQQLLLSRVQVEGVNINFYASANNSVPILKLKSVENGHFVTIDENGGEQVIQVFKADREELIIEDERGVIYYFKQFE